MPVLLLDSWWRKQARKIQNFPWERRIPDGHDFSLLPENGNSIYLRQPNVLRLGTAALRRREKDLGYPPQAALYRVHSKNTLDRTMNHATLCRSLIQSIMKGKMARVGVFVLISIVGFAGTYPGCLDHVPVGSSGPVYPADR
jgi:hypothetical protein